MKVCMLKKPLASLISSFVLGVGALSSVNVLASDLSDAIMSGKPTVDVNLRYETVDQEGKDATNALTIRSRIGYLTGDYFGFRGFAEYSGTQALKDRQNYHVGAGPDADTYTDQAVIADPSISRLNQAWLSYGFSGSELKVGKQRIKMDHRFLGNVGWRQTEQVYTGARLDFKAPHYFEADYAYITESDNIVGVQTPMQTHALKLDVKPMTGLTLTGYSYLIDVDNSAADSQTLGVRIAGSVPVEKGFSVLYHLEYADQSDYADSDNIGGDYYHVQLGAKYAGVTGLVAQEKLGGDGNSAFQTPLATKHAYNGWADKFLTTPNNGLVDTYAKLATKISGYKMAALYHAFVADKGGDSYGSEWDLLVAKKFAKHYTLGLKYANYQADKYATDTSKFWVWGSVKF